jgi:hypothetical protein
MNNKQTMSNYKTNKLMKGVSDTVYLAFVGVVSIGGAFYIYNDIATNQTVTQNTIVIEKVADKADEPKVLAVGIEKTKTTLVEPKSIETKDPVTHAPIIEAISQKSVTEITPAANNVVNIETTKTPVVTTTIAVEKPLEPETNSIEASIEKAPETIIEKAPETTAPETTTETVASEEPSADKEPSAHKEVSTVVEEVKQAVTSEVKQAITSSEENFNAMNNPHGFMHPAAMPPMPMPDDVQPQYNEAMQQATQYMPPEYRQYAPTYNNNPIRNNRNNQGYSDQGYRGQGYKDNNQQQNYNSQSPQNWQEPQMQQQRGQYNNMNQNYTPENYAPENYAPWNPGRFY